MPIAPVRALQRETPFIASIELAAQIFGVINRFLQRRSPEKGIGGRAGRGITNDGSSRPVFSIATMEMAPRLTTVSSACDERCHGLVDWPVVAKTCLRWSTWLARPAISPLNL